jgi:myosin I
MHGVQTNLQTKKAVFIIITSQKDGRTQTSLDRKIPLGAIKSIALSSLRDDWMVRSVEHFASIATNLRQCLNCNVSEEGDPIFSTYFKTELATNLLQLTQASISLLIGPTYVFHSADLFSAYQTHYSIDYLKKKDKTAQIKAVRDETVTKDDIYKSHMIHVPSGEPPNSKSRPPAKRKPGIVRPVTQGKLLKAGGPSVCKSTFRFDFFSMLIVIYLEIEIDSGIQAEACSSTPSGQVFH